MGSGGAVRDRRRNPFEPFNLHVSEGSTLQVRHPEQIVISKRSCHVGVGASKDGPFQEIVIVANVHVTRIEPLNGAPSPRKRKGES